MEEADFSLVAVVSDLYLAVGKAASFVQNEADIGSQTGTDSPAGFWTENGYDCLLFVDTAKLPIGFAVLVEVVGFFESLTHGCHYYHGLQNAQTDYTRTA